MKNIIRIILFLVIAFTCFSEAQTTQAIQAPASTQINDKEKLLFKDKFLIPSTAEVFVALNSLSTANWKNISYYIQKDPYKKKDSYKNTYIVGLNLGIRVADGFLFIQAEDKKNFSDTALIIKKLASNIGISKEIIKKSDKIKDYTNKGDWKGLKKELDGLQTSIMDDISKISDKDTATLTSMAAWLEGIHILSKILSEKYDVDGATIFRQPDLIDFFLGEMEKLNPKVKQLEEVKLLERNLKEVRELCNVDKGKPISKENVKKVLEITSELIKTLEKSNL